MDDLFSMAGPLAAITSMTIQILKNLLPKKIPTKILTIVVAIIITFVYFLFISNIEELNLFYIIKLCIEAIFNGIIVSFVSMFGFDSFKEIIDRYGGEK